MVDVFISAEAVPCFHHFFSDWAVGVAFDECDCCSFDDDAHELVGPDEHYVLVFFVVADCGDGGPALAEVCCDDVVEFGH